jgi:4-amino-4-deoxy-L-arabinose transferase-like glycosyltransferase
MSAVARPFTGDRLAGRLGRAPWTLLLALLLLALLFGARVLLLQLLASDGVSLHVDEAQYWDWSREPAWGYYSKPPVIAALIGLSQALFGSHETGLRLLTLVCWTATAGVLASLAHAIAASTPQGSTMHAARDRFAIWALVAWAVSPLAGLLGLVATTDAPLLLAWALALRLLWSLRDGGSVWGWVALGLVAALGLLAKYTFAALLPGALLWLLWLRRRSGQQPAAPGPALALAVALACVAPHLVWNATAGWPTLHHTAEITLRSAPVAAALSAALMSGLSFAAAQPLLLAPLLLPALLWTACRQRSQRLQPLPHAATALLLATTVPLLIAGLAQALRGRAEVNWIAPAHLAGALALAWVAAQVHGGRGAGWRWPLAQGALVTTLALAPALWALARPAVAVPTVLDPWARLRGWGPALHMFEPWLDREPGALVVGSTRTVLAQAAWHWRHRIVKHGRLPPRAAWAPTPAHHYAWRCPWPAPGGRASSAPVFLLAEGEPDAALVTALGGIEVLHRARVQRRDRPGVELLWARALAPAGAGDEGGLCR